MPFPAPTLFARFMPQILDVVSTWELDDSDSNGIGAKLLTGGVLKSAAGRHSGSYARAGTRMYRNADTDFQLAAALTVVAEVFPTGVGIAATIAEFGGDSSATLAKRIQWALRVGNDGNESFGYYAEGDAAGTMVPYSLDSPAVLQLNRWQVLTLTRDATGASVKLYLDGVEVASSAVLAAPSGGTSGNLSLFQSQRAGAELFPGAIGRFGVYGREFTLEQVRWLVRRLRRGL